MSGSEKISVADLLVEWIHRLGGDRSLAGLLKAPLYKGDRKQRTIQHMILGIDRETWGRVKMAGSGSSHGGR